MGGIENDAHIKARLSTYELLKYVPATKRHFRATKGSVPRRAQISPWRGEVFELEVGGGQDPSRTPCSAAGTKHMRSISWPSTSHKFVNCIVPMQDYCNGICEGSRDANRGYHP